MTAYRPREFIYAIAATCYASSHDDFIGIASTEAKAKVHCDSLNSDYLVQTNQTKYPYDSPPFYSFPVEITKFLKWNGESWVTKEEFLSTCPVWEVFYGAPSLGEFDIFPQGWKVIEQYTIDDERVMSYE